MSVQGEAFKWMTLLYLLFPTNDAKKLGIKNLNFQVLGTVQDSADIYAIYCLLAQMGFIHTCLQLRKWQEKLHLQKKLR